MTGVSFRSRHKDHMFRQLRGEYSIIDMNFAAQGIYVRLWPGYYGAARSKSKSEDKEFNSFLTKYETLLPHLELYMDHMKFFVLRFGSEVSSRHLKLLEGNIAITLRADGFSSFLPEGIIYHHKLKKEEEPIGLNIENYKNLNGLRGQYTIEH